MSSNCIDLSSDDEVQIITENEKVDNSFDIKSNTQIKGVNLNPNSALAKLNINSNIELTINIEPEQTNDEKKHKVVEEHKSANGFLVSESRLRQFLLKPLHHEGTVSFSKVNPSSDVIIIDNDDDKDEYTQKTGELKERKLPSTVTRHEYTQETEVAKEKLPSTITGIDHVPKKVTEESSGSVEKTNLSDVIIIDNDVDKDEESSHKTKEEKIERNSLDNSISNTGEKSNVVVENGEEIFIIDDDDDEDEASCAEQNKTKTEPGAQMNYYNGNIILRNLSLSVAKSPKMSPPATLRNQIATKRVAQLIPVPSPPGTMRSQTALKKVTQLVAGPSSGQSPTPHSNQPAVKSPQPSPPTLRPRKQKPTTKQQPTTSSQQPKPKSSMEEGTKATASNATQGPINKYSVENMFDGLVKRACEIFQDKSLSTRLWKHFRNASDEVLTNDDFLNALKLALKGSENVKLTNLDDKVMVSRNIKEVMRILKRQPEIVNRKLRRLEKMLQLITKRIHKLEEMEVTSSEDEEAENVYDLLDRHRLRATRIYSKMCELQGQAAHAGRAVLQKFHFSGTSGHPKIEHALEKYFNKTRTFPDFVEVKRLIEATAEKEMLQISSIDIHNIAQSVFVEFGNKLQRMRKCDDYTILVDYLDDGTMDPALNDEDLFRKLEENKHLRKKESDVLAEYAKKQVELKMKGEIKSDEEETGSESEDKKKKDFHFSDTEDELMNDNVVDGKRKRYESEDENEQLEHKSKRLTRQSIDMGATGSGQHSI